MLTQEELQEVFDEMRIGKVVNTMKKEKDSVEEEQEELKGEYYVLYQERTVPDAVCTACD